MIFNKIKFQTVNWNRTEFIKWLRDLDENWEWKTQRCRGRLKNTIQYIANGEVVAIIKFKHLYNYELFSEELKIKKDLLKSL